MNLLDWVFGYRGMEPEPRSDAEHIVDALLRRSLVTAVRAGAEARGVTRRSLASLDEGIALLRASPACKTNDYLRGMLSGMLIARSLIYDDPTHLPEIMLAAFGGRAHTDIPSNKESPDGR